jgi:hypothetical protein
VVRVRHLMFGGLALAALLAWIQLAAPGQEGGGRFPVVPLVAAAVFLVAVFSPAAERPLADDPTRRTKWAVIAGMVVVVVAMFGTGVWLAATAD